MPHKKSILDTRMFRPNRPEKENLHININAALIAIAKEDLLKELNEEQKNILLQKIIYQSDINSIETMRELDLVEKLLIDCGFSFVIWTKRFEKLSAKIYLPDNEKMNADHLIILKKLIPEIDLVWQKRNIATISIDGRTIRFELLVV